MLVYFVTGNDFKFEMAQERLSSYSVRLEKKGFAIPEIQSDSLREIAMDKARKAFVEVKKPVLVMDAGLFIEKYNGFPGPYTSYAEETLGLSGLIELIGGPTSAETRQVVAYKDEEDEKTFESGQKGTLLTERRGKGGYFFDYIFESHKNDKTLAEMNREERSRAWGDRWDQLGQWLKSSK